MRERRNEQKFMQESKQDQFEQTRQTAIIQIEKDLFKEGLLKSMKYIKKKFDEKEEFSQILSNGVSVDQNLAESSMICKSDFFKAEIMRNQKVLDEKHRM
jgi:hypothetical protein